MSTFYNELTEYSPQMETFEFEQYEQESVGESGAAGVFSESEELELAAQLLEVNNEQELDRFLGDLIKKAGSAVGQFVRSDTGRAIGGVLKSAAKRALPVAGGALGAYFGGPLGAKIGSGLASMAGQALGLELEGLSQEDREFEATKQFVRFAGEAVKNALTAPQAADQGEMQTLQSAASLGANAFARAAAEAAARKHAPGLMGGTGIGIGGTAMKGHGGRWIRRGNSIVLFGV